MISYFDQFLFGDGECLTLLFLKRVRNWLCFLAIVFFRLCMVVSLGSSASSMMQPSIM